MLPVEALLLFAVVPVVLFVEAEDAGDEAFDDPEEAADEAFDDPFVAAGEAADGLFALVPVAAAVDAALPCFDPADAVFAEPEPPDVDTESPGIRSVLKFRLICLSTST